MSLNHEQSSSATSSTTGLGASPRSVNKSSWRTASLLLSIVLFAVSIIAFTNHMGVRITGDVLAWQHWIRAHALHFFIWRLFLYGIAAAGWVWLRRSKLQRLPTKEMARQLLRTEFFIVAFIVIFEIQRWLLRS